MTSIPEFSEVLAQPDLIHCEMHPLSINTVSIQDMALTPA